MEDFSEESQSASEIQNFSEIISRAFSNIKASDAENAVRVYSKWEKVLLKIKSSQNPNEGQNLAAHSRVVDCKNGVLLVEADHPGWIELLQLHKKFIINGMNFHNEGTKIETLAFRLKGKRGELFDAGESTYSEKDVRSEMENRIEQEEKFLAESHVSGSDSGKNGNSSAEKAEKKSLPPELAAIFEDLKKSMLTNSKN